MLSKSTKHAVGHAVKIHDGHEQGENTHIFAHISIAKNALSKFSGIPEKHSGDTK